MRFRLERTQLIPHPLAEVFPFFSDAANLEQLTPPFVGFEILSDLPVEMREGALIDYRIRLLGVPVRWRTRIALWEPGVRFVDTQLRGPYRYWHHLHEFESVATGTLMRDIVHYEVPFGWLGRAVRPWLVEPALDRIFDYRRQAIERIFTGGEPEAQVAPSTA